MTGDDRSVLVRMQDGSIQEVWVPDEDDAEDDDSPDMVSAKQILAHYQARTNAAATVQRVLVEVRCFAKTGRRENQKPCGRTIGRVLATPRGPLFVGELISYRLTRAGMGNKVPGERVPEERVPVEKLLGAPSAAGLEVPVFASCTRHGSLDIDEVTLLAKAREAQRSPTGKKVVLTITPSAVRQR